MTSAALHSVFCYVMHHVRVGHAIQIPESKKFDSGLHEALVAAYIYIYVVELLSRKNFTGDYTGLQQKFRGSGSGLC